MHDQLHQVHDRPYAGRGRSRGSHCQHPGGEEGIVPPTIGYQEPDPECDLDYVPNTARKAQIDLALSASLGFGGHNAYLAFRPVE